MATKPPLRAAALIFAAAVIVTGCGARGNPGTTTTTTNGSPGAAWSRPDSPPDPRTLLRAAATALAGVPDSTLVFIESQTDDTGTWKVQLVSPDGSEQQTKIGSDGEVALVGPTPVNDGDADKADRRAAAQATRLDYSAAVDKALGAVPNGSITTLALTGGSSPVWRADVWDTDLVEHQVTIDAVSGAVTGNKQV